jgi:hypothetical protein
MRGAETADTILVRSEEILESGTLHWGQLAHRFKDLLERAENVKPALSQFVAFPVP